MPAQAAPKEKPAVAGGEPRTETRQKHDFWDAEIAAKHAPAMGPASNKEATMIKHVFVTAAALALLLATGSAHAGSKLGIQPDRTGAGQAAGGKIGGGMDKDDGGRRGG